MLTQHSSCWVNINKWSMTFLSFFFIVSLLWQTTTENITKARQGKGRTYKRSSHAKREQSNLRMFVYSHYSDMERMSAHRTYAYCRHISIITLNVTYWCKGRTGRRRTEEKEDAPVAMTHQPQVHNSTLKLI